MEAQVDKQKYNFEKYCSPDRWASYFRQLDEVIKKKPSSVLEIGAGDKVLANYLKNNTDIDYKCLDVADDLLPDIIGSVDDIPCSDNSFDLVCAFEVLEHLPFEKFSKCLNELKRVSKKSVLLSLPHWGRHFSLELRLPFFGRISGQYKFNLFSPKHKFNGEHYWEIGKKGYPLRKIIKDFEKAGLTLERQYIAFESPYHHFFILKK